QIKGVAQDKSQQAQGMAQQAQGLAQEKSQQAQDFAGQKSQQYGTTHGGHSSQQQRSQVDGTMNDRESYDALNGAQHSHNSGHTADVAARVMAADTVSGGAPQGQYRGGVPPSKLDSTGFARK
ncbi:hypothetical protein LTR53_019266, partial [Teratosphaeriaceae sp. CCFEE 6253]